MKATILLIRYMMTWLRPVALLMCLGAVLMLATLPYAAAGGGVESQAS